jgi:hypothetical protein
MAAEIVQIDTQDFTSQTYEGQDINLISSFEVNTSLSSSSYIEYFIYDNNQNLLSTDYNFTQYTVLADGQSAGFDNTISQIIIDPEKSLLDSGYDQGEYITYFNFFNKQIGSELQQLYIVEISSDRTELRLDSTSLTDLDIVEQANSLIQQREDSPYFLDFYLNFGDNQLAIANNIQLDNQDPTNPTILIKLYEALSEDFDINSTLWIVTLVEESIAYKVIFEDIPIIITDTIPLSGPNFNLDLKDKINNSTVSLDYTSLTTTALTSSQNQLKSLLEEKGLDINIDYTNFNDFIHFSSAEARLENFYYKMSLLEDYSSSIALLNNTTNNNPSGSIAVYESLTSNIITNFDDYEYYLYYTSGSSAWPKTTSQPPYQLATTGSVAVNTWYDNIIVSASNFDNLNQNNLYYSIPEYLRDDSANAPYQTFVEMVGQFYDNIWIYYKDVTQKYNADNRLEYGISKDIVADAIRDFGIKLYQNNFSNDDLYTAFIGLTPQGGLFPFPNITGSLPTPSGFEYIDTLISASNDYMPLDDVNKSLYKRIYHNLPYLLKAKGTLPGLRTLITSYGIPDTVLRINEFGGKDKSNVNDWDDWQNTFNYAYHNTGSNKITTDWTLNPSWNSADDVPSTLEFRFKIPNLSTVSGSPSIDLLRTDGESRIQLRYTGSGLATGSYSGSIINPYYQYTHLDFYPDLANFSNSSASIYLPFANEGWWSVMVTRTGNDFTLYAGNNVYEGGENGTQLGFYATSSVNENSTGWSTSTTVNFMPQNTEMYLQEIRYYNTVLSESMFKDYIMNPYSSEGNYLNSSPDQLAFRLTLGGELYTGSLSVHPKITGSWVTTSSFVGHSSASFASTPIFIPNTEHFFFDQPVVGIKNAISDKIRIENSVIPSGNTLSPFRSLAQNTAASQSYTANTNLLEVAFAPQDEINEDIISQIGYFNIGEFIGDPRQRSSSATSYPDLDALRNEYFEKYTSNYDLNDYIRLIKYFDNSLFKMIKDFVPARTSLASGVVIKQTLLERNKYPQPQTNINSTIAYASSGSQNNIPLVFQNIEVSGTVAPQWNNYQPGTIENFSGGTGGSFEPFNGINTSPYGPNGTGPQNIFGITQSWTEGVVTPLGIANTVYSSQDEFYDGEFSGSVLVVTTQSLAQPYPLKNIASYYKQVHYYGTGSNDSNIFLNNFLNNVTAPQSGSILFYNEPAIFGGTPSYNLFLTKYLKIAKIDCSGSNNTNVLGNINKSVIFNEVLGTYFEYDLVPLNEFPTYYLYESTPKAYIPSSFPNQVFNYAFSASNAGTFIPSSTTVPDTFTLYGSVSGNTLGYFNSTTGIHTLNNTPNTLLSITGSVTIGGTGGGRFRIDLLRQGSVSNITNITISAGNSYTLSASYYGLQGDQIYLSATRGAGSPQFQNGSLLITQSRAVSSSNCSPVIFEPYITEPNYYNSDYNPLFNNVLVDRLSSIYQDIDYSTGIYTPTNFNLLISGSALKAAVQDSNYTSKRVVLPRYEGSKSTSQHLNYWTPGDVGTYGKLPTVESLKTMVAYCDDIGGWPPERENASAALVKYLIKADGTVVIPNTTPNSLADNQETFESGENVLIQYAGTGNQATPIRKIIRGGTRIEPILYTQYGQNPASWNTTMSFSTDFITSTAVGSYIAKSAPTTYAAINDASYAGVNMNNNILLGAQASLWTSNYYTVNQDLIDENVTLIAGGEIEVGIISSALGAQSHNVIVRLIRERGGIKTVLVSQTKTINQPEFYSGQSYIWGTNSIGYIYPIFEISAAILPQDMLSGDRIYYDAVHITSTYGEPGNPSVPTVYVNKNTSYLFIAQSPAQTNTTVHSTGINTLWGYPNPTKLYAITCSNPTLNQLYDNGFTMNNITGSGFNSIVLEWNIKYGDEFKFEGNENNVFVVKRVYDVNDFDTERVSQTGSIEIQFNSSLPSASINLDHFAIRRYVDDASQILIEGFKPTNSSGPYIVRPEYIIPELDRNVDDFILILKEKGLI